MSQRRAREARRAAGADAPAGRRRFATRWAVGLAAVAVAAVVTVGVLVARGTGPAEAVPAIPAAGRVIDFTGTDPITGARVSVSDYAGKPVVINVWGSWCPGCIAEAEDLRTFVERHPEVQVIGVDLQDTRDAARAFYREQGWSHPSVFDPDGAISFSLGLQGTPTTFFLDREHRLVARIVGETDLAGFEQGLDHALGTTT